MFLILAMQRRLSSWMKQRLDPQRYILDFVFSKLRQEKKKMFFLHFCPMRVPHFVKQQCSWDDIKYLSFFCLAALRPRGLVDSGTRRQVYYIAYQYY
jgi:hypothetical protein